MLRVDENRTHHRKLEDSIFNRMWTNHLNILKLNGALRFTVKATSKKILLQKLALNI